MRNVSVGILGGMGPRAAVEFEKRLLDSLSGADQALPRIVSVNDGSIPDRSSFLLGNGNDPTPLILHNAQLLERAGVDFICLPCNTAFAERIIGRVKNELKTRILDMPLACVERAASQDAKSVLIIGTLGTRSSGVFEINPLLTCVYPDTKCQKSVNNIIDSVKAGCSPKRADIDRVNQEIKLKNTDAVILACTELSLIKNHLYVKSTVIDSIEELVIRCKHEIERTSQ